MSKAHIPPAVAIRGSNIFREKTKLSKISFPKSSSFSENFDENMSLCRKTDGKIENLKKEDKMRISTLIFIYTIHFAYLKVYTKFHNPKSSSC